MNTLQTFSFQESPVRVFGTPDNPLFCAADVCGVLGLENVSRALDGIDEDEKGVTTGKTLGGEQKLNVVTESGLYALAFKSRKPEAKTFRKWVTSEVLPSLRKTGVYLPPGLSTLDHCEILLKAAREQERRLAENERKITETHALAVQANAYNSANTGFFTVRGYAKIHGQRLTLNEAKEIGRRATLLCRRDEITTGRARDELFGEVNSYPVEVLDEVCQFAAKKTRCD